MRMASRALAALIISSTAMLGTPQFSAAADLTIVSGGGSFQEAQRKALWDPAAKALGLTFEEDTSQSWTEAKAQVDVGAVTWDIVNLNMAEVALAVKAGVIIKLPEDIIDRNDFIRGTVNDYCIGNHVASGAIGYSTAKFGEAGPASMVDFFDVKKFPGKRGLYKNPLLNMEAAALALGHSRAEVYDFLSTEEGRKAALDKIAELKPYAIWWDSGSQATQLIKDGEVDMLYGWNGRIIAAIDAGAPFKITYNDALLSIDCFAILKGAPHTDTAIKFLKEISKPEYGKDLPKYIAYGSANIKAYEGYDEATLARLVSSPQNLGNTYSINYDFWEKNTASISEAFDHMLASD